MEEKLKLKPNEWMISERFLSRIDYHNVYYIESLGKVLYNYIETIPIPIITTWDPVHKRIYFLVGQEKRFFEVDEFVSYNDYIYLVNKWLKGFFPKFYIEEEKEVDLDEEEVYEKVKEGVDFNEVVLLKKKGIVKDEGVITKIHITNDEFNLLRNGKEFVRISGTLDNLMPLSMFLRELRSIDDDIEKREFILTNSREIKQVNEQDIQTVVDYSSKMMMNFFILHYQDLKMIPIIRITSGIYEWGNYKISFESNELEKDCLRYLRQKRLDEGIEDV